jgi:hypothetical protein
VAPIRTDVLEERIASIIRVSRIDELGTLAVTTQKTAVTALKTSNLNIALIGWAL